MEHSNILLALVWVSEFTYARLYMRFLRRHKQFKLITNRLQLIYIFHFVELADMVYAYRIPPDHFPSRQSTILTNPGQRFSGIRPATFFERRRGLKGVNSHPYC